MNIGFWMGLDDDNRFYKTSSIHNMSDGGGVTSGTDGKGGSMHSSIWDGNVVLDGE